MAQLMNDVTVRVTVEVSKRGTYGDSNTIAKATVEEVSSADMDELGDKVVHVVQDAQRRALAQLENTRRILALEERNRLLASPVKDVVSRDPMEDPIA